MSERGQKIAEAVAFSRNFATAKPGIGLTEKEHILGLCDLLERAAAAIPPEPVAVPEGWKLVKTPITEDMHVAAVKALHRAHGVAGLPQRLLDAMLAAGPQLFGKAEQVPVSVPEDGDGCYLCFTYDGDGGFRLQGSAEVAKKYAQELLDEYREDAISEGDGWPDQVCNLFWGAVCGRAAQVEIREGVFDYVLSEINPAVPRPAILAQALTDEDIRDWIERNDVQMDISAARCAMEDARSIEARVKGGA